MGFCFKYLAKKSAVNEIRLKGISKNPLANGLTNGLEMP
jgi:hypothetical protein